MFRQQVFPGVHPLQSIPAAAPSSPPGLNSPAQQMNGDCPHQGRAHKRWQQQGAKVLEIWEGTEGGVSREDCWHSREVQWWC